MGVTTVVRLSPQERAVQEATKRTVLSMSLAMKDVTIDSLKRKFDRPTPYVLLPKAYQARPPKQVAGVWVSSFEIAPAQSAVLKFEFFRGDRKPGDAAPPARACSSRPN